MGGGVGDGVVGDGGGGGGGGWELGFLAEHGRESGEGEIFVFFGGGWGGVEEAREGL